VEEDYVLTQHWCSRTRATVLSYRMQRESDVFESVCEAGVPVHGCRRCRACHLCVCAVCVCARTHITISREQGPNKLSLISTPLHQTVLRRA
jgi:hypothetical protein